MEEDPHPLPSVALLHINDDAGDRVYAFASAHAAWLSWTRFPPVADFLAEHYPSFEDVPEDVEEMCRAFNESHEDLATVEETAVEAAPYEDGSLL